METFGDLLPLPSEVGAVVFGVSSPLSEDIGLLGEFSALGPAVGLSLSPVAPLSLFHSSKVGMSGGRLGGAGAFLLGPLLAGEVCGDGWSVPPGVDGLEVLRRL